MSYRVPADLSIEERIRLAKAERSVYMGYMIGEGLVAATRAVRSLLDRGETENHPAHPADAVFTVR